MGFWFSYQHLSLFWFVVEDSFPERYDTPSRTFKLQQAVSCQSRKTKTGTEGVQLKMTPIFPPPIFFCFGCSRFYYSPPDLNFLGSLNGDLKFNKPSISDLDTTEFELFEPYLLYALNTQLSYSCITFGTLLLYHSHHAQRNKHLISQRSQSIWNLYEHFAFSVLLLSWAPPSMQALFPQELHVIPRLPIIGT